MIITGGKLARATAKAVAGPGITVRKNKMRIAAGLIFAGAVSLCASGTAWSQTPATKSAATPPPAAVAAPVPAAAPAPAKAPCSNPNALGIGRVVEIDTTGGPGFGFEHF